MRLPNDTERHAIVGTTGSGKTVFGLWALSHRNYDQKPWVIIDFKREPQIGAIPHLEEFGIDDAVPDEPGLYAVRPTPYDIDTGGVSDLLMRIYEQENTGVFIDEGYMIRPMDRGLRALLTQGRSKHIPMICLAQRPAHISPFLLSESEFKSVFYLEHPADIDRINEWMPACDPSKLPDHHSLYYQREGRQLKRLAPCEPMDKVYERFDRRLAGEPAPEYFDLFGRQIDSRPLI